MAPQPVPPLRASPSKVSLCPLSRVPLAAQQPTFTFSAAPAPAPAGLGPVSPLQGVKPLLVARTFQAALLAR
jgi:hypothetical protein